MQAVTYDEGKKLINNHVCGECGAALTLPWGGAYGVDSYVVRCSVNSGHKGIVKAPTVTRLGRERMESMGGTPEEIATWENRFKEKEPKMSKELVPYERSTALTTEQASSILKQCWPGAPAEEVARAALLCQSYQLNPLMKHVYLIKFGNAWSTVMGIGATRLIASRGGGYSYIDGPRRMTDAEQESIRGEVDQDNIWAIVVLRKSDGNTAPGYGFWPRDVKPYGTDKGNSALNMAMVRAERQAFGRLFPAEMPHVGVVDEGFMSANDYSVKVIDNEDDVFEVIPDRDEVGEPAPTYNMSPVENLGDLFKRAYDTFGLSPAEALAAIGVSNKGDIPVSKLDEAWQQIVAVRGEQR